MVLGFDEASRLISTSRRGVNFLKGRRIKCELGGREFYFLAGKGINYLEEERIPMRAKSKKGSPREAVKK